METDLRCDMPDIGAIRRATKRRELAATLRAAIEKIDTILRLGDRQKELLRELRSRLRDEEETLKR